MPEPIPANRRINKHAILPWHRCTEEMQFMVVFLKTDRPTIQAIGHCL